MTGMSVFPSSLRFGELARCCSDPLVHVAQLSFPARLDCMAAGW